MIVPWRVVFGGVTGSSNGAISPSRSWCLHCERSEDFGGSEVLKVWDPCIYPPPHARMQSSAPKLHFVRIFVGIPQERIIFFCQDGIAGSRFNPGMWMCKGDQTLPTGTWRITAIYKAINLGPIKGRGPINSLGTVFSITIVTSYLRVLGSSSKWVVTKTLFDLLYI